MEMLGFVSCKADPDIWCRPATKQNEQTYYKYVLLYIDDCLVISAKPESIFRQEIGKIFQLKEELIGIESSDQKFLVWQRGGESSRKLLAFSVTYGIYLKLILFA